MARRRTTAVLRPQTTGAEAQNRTGDTTVFSRVLYQLSYLGDKCDSILCELAILSTAAVPLRGARSVCDEATLAPHSHSVLRDFGDWRACVQCRCLQIILRRLLRSLRLLAMTSRTKRDAPPHSKNETARHLYGHPLSLLTARDNPEKGGEEVHPKNKDRRGKPAVLRSQNFPLQCLRS